MRAYSAMEKRILLHRGESVLSIHNNKILLEHYEQILFISANRVKVVTDAAEIEFVGEHIQVLALEKNELLMEGVLSQVRFQHVQ